MYLQNDHLSLILGFCGGVCVGPPFAWCLCCVCVLFVFFLCLVCALLPLSLYCPFLIAPSVFSIVYVLMENGYWGTLTLKTSQRNLMFPAKLIFILSGWFLMTFNKSDIYVNKNISSSSSHSNGNISKLFHKHSN